LAILLYLIVITLIFTSFICKENGLRFPAYRALIFRNTSSMKLANTTRTTSVGTLAVAAVR